MNMGELHHLLFRWLHVVTAVLWIGHTWSLVFAAVWTLLADRPTLAAAISLVLVAGIAQGLSEFMTGRAVTLVALGCATGLSLQRLSVRR